VDHVERLFGKDDGDECGYEDGEWKCGCYDGVWIAGCCCECSDDGEYGWCADGYSGVGRSAWSGSVGGCCWVVGRWGIRL
jgi:hypothetical protein